MSEFEFSGIIIGLLAMMFFTPFCMAKGISKMEKELDAKEYLLCAIPIFNIIRSEIKYHGKIHLCTIGYIIVLVGIIQRIALWWYMWDNPTVAMISVIFFFASLAIWFVTNMIYVYTVIHDANAVTGFKLFLLTVAFPFGQYYVGSYLANVVRHNQEREATFKK